MTIESSLEGENEVDPEVEVGPMDQIVARFEKIVDALVSALNKRFALSDKQNHLEWISFLNLRNWPARNSEGKLS